MNSNTDAKIFVLVITYKNVVSLKKCLERLFLQSEAIDRIVVLNNASKDETESYLDTVKDKVDTVHLKVNTGGAGGYHYGLKYCVEKGADWIWCVEDDILSSRNFVPDFKTLLNKDKKAFEKIGFLYPKVYSILSRHKMDGSVFIKQPEQKYMDFRLLDKAQFAGCIINAAAIRKAGLPIREFFIYYDDWEFTARIIKKGFYGCWLPDFFVWHNDSEVRQPRPYLNRRRQDIWKHFYGIRNELYILRKKNILTFIRPFLMNLFYIPFLILKERKEDKLFVAFNWFLWTMKSLFFKTEIKFPDGVIQ